MKPQGIKKTIDLGDGKVISLETGILAKQAATIPNSRTSPKMLT